MIRNSVVARRLAWLVVAFITGASSAATAGDSCLASAPLRAEETFLLNLGSLDLPPTVQEIRIEVWVEDELLFREHYGFEGALNGPLVLPIWLGGARSTAIAGVSPIEGIEALTIRASIGEKAVASWSGPEFLALDRAARAGGLLLTVPVSFRAEHRAEVGAVSGELGGRAERVVLHVPGRGAVLR